MSDSLVCCKAFIFFIYLLFAITNVILGIVNSSKCNFTDEMGLDVADYLLGIGIYGLVNSVFLLISFCSKLTKIRVLIIILDSLFGFIWFILGSIILFRSNIVCIQNKTGLVIYALILWCLSALEILTCVCNTRSGKEFQEI